MTISESLLLFMAALLGGALNSVAGGGSFIAFPALIFSGVGSKLANATTTVALWPGAIASAGAYRKEFDTERSLLLWLGGVSIVGGVLGAILFLHTPQPTFSRLIPYLLLAATLLFAFGGWAAERLRARISRHRLPPSLVTGTVIVLQLPISIYGGFFGGGMSILMLATLGLTGMKSLHTMNALKAVLAACINGVAIVTFIIAREVAWPQALTMVAGAVAGGYGGAHFARKLDQRVIRRFVILVGCVMTLIFFVHGA